MGRGLSQRRRVSNYERARQAKSGILPLPPPPDEVEKIKDKHKKKGNKSISDQGPASFRRMMRGKAYLKGNDPPIKKAVPRTAASKNKFRTAHSSASANADTTGHGLLRIGFSANKPISSLMPSPAASNPPASSPAEEQDTEAGPAEDTEVSKKPDKGIAEVTPVQSDLFGKKSMKAKKKEFLKRRKLKKKGMVQDTADEGNDSMSEDLEDHIMTDRHKPAFGEQALQPLKVNLKRKHWTGKGQESCSKRLQQVFLRQLQHAEAATKLREAERRNIAEAFRAQKRQKKRVPFAGATKATLAALVSRNEAAAAEH